MNVHTRFVAREAAEARNEAPVPLLIGLTGPSGSGKTYSALRLATGIRQVVGGEIFVIDTEQRRALHYADRFDFKHVNFQAPFGSLDYLEALRFAKSQGAGVVIIDSCSHEHDGPGGLLEQHEAELTRMAGQDSRKREAMQMLAWQKPKAARRKLITAITTELAMPAIFCFRAKHTTKPMKVDGKMKPVDLGFCSIGADEWLFEMALNALFLPGSNGHPIWQSDMPGERLAIKLPEQFAALRDRNAPFDEKLGKHFAEWAAKKVTRPTEQKPTERFTAQNAGHDPLDDEPADEPMDTQVDEPINAPTTPFIPATLAKIEAAGDNDALDAIDGEIDEAIAADIIAADDTGELYAAIARKRQEFRRAGRQG